MYQIIFRNKWIALAFVVITLISVSVLVGTNEKDGTVQATADKLVAQRESAKSAMHDLGMDPGAAPPAPVQSEAVEYVDDEDLIDDASGFDPTPEEEQADVAEEGAETPEGEEEDTTVSG